MKTLDGFKFQPGPVQCETGIKSEANFGLQTQCSGVDMPGLASSQPRRVLAGLLILRESWRLSWRGKILVLLLLASALVLAHLLIHSWLAVTSTVPSDYLVVEGWIGVGGLKQAVVEFDRGGYGKILTSGSMKKDEGNPDKKETYADWSAQDLQRLGVSSNVITAIPSWVEHKDRTYHSALAVKQWFQNNHIPVRSIDVISLGPHARRTRLMYEKAFGSGVKVGIIAAEDTDYDPKHWWRTSEGVREVIGEAIAYVYARIFFHPAEDKS